MKQVELEKIKSLLGHHGLKSTPLRVGLLAVLRKHHSPLSADDMTRKLKNIDYDQASLFRSLKALSEKGVLNVVDLGEGFHRYELKCHEHSHHHHVMCSQCKKITVIPFCIPPKIVNYLKKSGYTEVTHRMDFFGLCAECSK